MARKKESLPPSLEKNETPLVLQNNSELKVEVWPIQQALAVRWGGNPRTIKDTELKSLRDSLREFGVTIPLIYNSRTRTLISGHQRLKAAEAENLEQIPVTIVDLAPGAATALALALNKIEGKWDYELLEQVLLEIGEFGGDLKLTGFNETELISLFASNVEEEPIDDEFEKFVNRQIGGKTRELIYFRSPKVSFSCTKAAYDVLVRSFYGEVGLDDFQARKLFFQRLGLPAPQ